MSSDGSDYEVGYKKPPLHTRFGPGNPGRGKGRPKGRRNLKTDLMDELGERITLNEGDRKVRISKQRALVKSLIFKGIKGDARATHAILNLLLRIGSDDEQTAEPLSEVDRLILDDFLDREGDSHE
jgi:hypothetical protein